jgi:hypothetical protein
MNKYKLKWEKLIKQWNTVSHEKLGFVYDYAPAMRIPQEGKTVSSGYDTMSEFRILIYKKSDKTPVFRMGRTFNEESTWKRVVERQFFKRCMMELKIGGLDNYLKTLECISE